MKRNCRQRTDAYLAFAMYLKIETTAVSCEERNTLRCFDSREPDKRQSARVHHAIFRCNTNFNDLLGFQAIQHDKSTRPFQLDAPVRMRRAGCSAIFLFQTASSAIPIIPVVVAASATLASNFVDAIPDPFGRFGFSREFANGRIETCADSTRLQLRVFNTRSLRRL